MATKPTRANIDVINGQAGRIHNYLWQNASPHFRDQVPRYESTESLPRIGESLAQNPGLWNEWLSGLVDKIGLTLVRSATFYNQFQELRKGNLDYGQHIEEIFVQEAELRDFDPNKAHARELRRTPARVQSVFHTVNFSGQYAVTTSHEGVRGAFTSEGGVMDLLNRIITSLSNAAITDDRDLFLYTMTRQILDGAVRVETVDWDETDFNSSAKNLARASRSLGHRLTNPRRDFNTSGVLTTSSVDDLYLIIDADTRAVLDVDMLASAFNVSSTEMVGRIIVIDEWDSIKFDRFEQLRENTDSMVEYTPQEMSWLASGAMKMLIVDRNWFQMYDRLFSMNSTFVGSGEYTNHFLNVKRVYAVSPFANAVAFVSNPFTEAVPETLDVVVSQKQVNELGYTALAIDLVSPVVADFDAGVEDNVLNNVAVMPNGSLIAPEGADAILRATVGGVTYELTITPDTVEAGATLTLPQVGAEPEEPGDGDGGDGDGDGGAGGDGDGDGGEETTP